jgi:penicillin-binding protein 1A
MTAAHRGVEIKDIAGVAAPAKPTAAAAAKMAASEDDATPAPPPVLTKRGAEILVRVEKMLDEAGKSIGKTSSAEPANTPPSSPPKPVTTGAVAFPESFAAASPGDQANPAPRKN